MEKYLMNNALIETHWAWLCIGLLGQLLFSARFWVQWIASERRKRSHIPVAFWYLSLSGGLTLLVYSIYRADPVFILGQSTGVLIYARNLWLLRRERQTEAQCTS